MTNTDDLIRSLAEDVRPVRRLSPPLWRALGWGGLAVPAVITVAAVMGFRPDLAARMAESGFVLGLVACLATAGSAAVAALALGVPGRSKAWALLPVPSLLIWLGHFGRQCVLEGLGLYDGDLLTGPHLHCLPDIAVMTGVPTVVMLGMVQSGARFERRLAVLLGGLAAAALANAGLSLAHPQDAGLLVLLIQFAAVGLISMRWGRTIS